MRLFWSALLLAALVATPLSSAHERYYSSDDQFLIVLGEQDEPVYTYDFTNLDLIISVNATGERVAGVEQTLSAVLIAPDGSEHTTPLKVQHGQVGRYEFQDDYILTMAGQYQVRLTGDIQGVDVSGTYLLPGPRGDAMAQTFPATGLDDLAALNARIAALEAELADLEREGTTSNGIPGIGLVALIGALMGLIALRRK